ncbi:MAG: glycosyltransferase family 39 protein [Thermoanaerobaculales bacterium]
MSPRRVLIATLLIGTLVRLAGGWAMGLGVDESYQVANADTFQLSYFDHPPLAFWLSWATKRLVPAATPLLLRLPFIVLTTISTLLVARLGTRLHDARAGAFGALLFNLAPLWGIAGGWALPDVPLTVGILLAANGLLDVLDAKGSPHGWVGWMITGAGLGIALLSKYHAVLLVVGIVAFLFATRTQRRRLAHPAPWVAALVALVMLSPVLIWNWQHGWVSLTFQAGRAVPGVGHRLVGLATGLLGPALFLTPWLWWPLLREGARAVRRGPNDERGFLLACLAAPPVLLFSLLPLLGARVLAHWAGPGFLLVVPLLGREVATRWEVHSDSAVHRWLRLAVVATPVLWLAVLPQASWSAWRRVIPAWPPTLDPTYEAVGWVDLRDWASRHGYLDRPELFAATTSWRDGGKAAVALGADLPVIVLGPDPRNFAFSRDPRAMLGRDAILFGPEDRFAEAMATCRPHFRAIEPLPSLPITRGGQVELRLGLARARGFAGPSPVR